MNVRQWTMHEILMKMERSLSRNKTMNKLTLCDINCVTLPKQFCHHLLLGIGRNSSLSDVDLVFSPQSWDCPDDVPAGGQGSIQHLTLQFVPVDVLANMFTLFSTVKERKCEYIFPPQEDEVREEELKLNEMEQALTGMSRLETLVLGMGHGVPDSLMLKFGIHILKVISKNSIGDFKLYDWGKRGELLTEMLARLTPDESSRFSIGQYTNFGGHPYPCIRLSPSNSAHYQAPGGPHFQAPLTQVLHQAHGGFPPPSSLTLAPRCLPPFSPCPHPQQHSVPVLHYSSDAPGPSRISAPAPPPAPPTELGWTPFPPPQPLYNYGQMDALPSTPFNTLIQIRCALTQVLLGTTHTIRYSTKFPFHQEALPSLPLSPCIPLGRCSLAQLL